MAVTIKTAGTYPNVSSMRDVFLNGVIYCGEDGFVGAEVPVGGGDEVPVGASKFAALMGGYVVLEQVGVNFQHRKVRFASVRPPP